MPESSGFQSDAASSSLFVHIELGTRTALVQLCNSAESTVHGFFQRLAYYRRQPQTLAVVQLHRSLHCGPLQQHSDTISRYITSVLQHETNDCHLSVRDCWGGDVTQQKFIRKTTVYNLTCQVYTSGTALCAHVCTYVWTDHLL